MKKIRFTFEKGGTLIAQLNEKDAPQTAAFVWDSLPLESVATQSRWSGREFNLQAAIHHSPVRENQTIYTSIGEVCYWRDWRQDPTDAPKHVVAVYYGAELARSHYGDEPVNVFGQIEYDQLHAAKQIGERIWLEGAEKIKIERVE